MNIVCLMCEIVAYTSNLLERYDRSQSKWIMKCNTLIPKSFAGSCFNLRYVYRLQVYKFSELHALFAGLITLNLHLVWLK